MLGFSKRSQKKASKSPLEIFDQYEQGRPAHQNAIDALQGWNCAFPPEFGLNAGNLPLYADDRIDWALHTFGSIEGRTVLEVGPLEDAYPYAELPAPGADRCDRSEPSLFSKMSGHQADSEHRHRLFHARRHSGVADGRRRNL